MSVETEEKLYQERVAIHPKSVKGAFRTFKTGVLVLAYAVFFLLPWLRWDRGDGPSQAVLFDIPGRRFYIFDLIVHPQDIYWLAGALIIFAWLLFFVTGVVGRAFCGYFCFQTLWTDAFMFIERWVQGDRQKRINIDKIPWNAEKIRKKGLTWAAWLVFAWITGFTFTAYWTDAPGLLGDFFTGHAASAAYITIGLLTAITFVVAGFVREQVCIYMCPYSRFQTVMFDKETLIPSYDYKRGEGETGRAHLGRGLKTREERQAAGHGDCVDCGLCVQVCPTGIDIRNGLQIACINCGLCIDACNEIMDKQGWERGLIRYASEQEIETGVKPRVFKPKTIGYGLAILVVIGLLAYGVLHQAPMDFSVNQVRNPLAVTLADGRVQNSYEIKINNKVPRPLRLDLGVEGLADAEIEIAGGKKDIEVPSDKLLRLLVRVKLPEGAKGTQQNFRFVLTDKDGQIEPVAMNATFNMPR
ncbi:cytochrome c oxidase accessory protein CcoG [Thiofaba sp. EF100]|uniref:cytochrome c oxidase accessory protein CcoG n=1 Tax=Thiofaba sp. EF100 TaxID=3121274 RepID=UPI0032216651